MATDAGGSSPKDAASESPPREFMMLLTPSIPTFETNQRVNQQAFMDFVQAVEGTTKDYFQKLPQGQGLDLQVACAVLPQNKLLLEIQAQPDNIPEETIVGLRQRLESLPRPAVRLGPVAFSIRSMVWGGCARTDAGFGFPFASLAQSGKQRWGKLDDILMEAAGCTLAAESWWGKIKRALGLGG